MIKRDGWQFFLLILALSFAGASWGQEKIEKKSKAKRDVTLEGKAVCIGCDLKKEEGFHSQCSIYGHKHVLLDDEGRYYTFLENDRSVKLIQGERVHGKRIRVKGDLVPEAHYVDVKSYSVEEEGGSWTEIGWCELCGEMDRVVGHVHKKKGEKKIEDEGKNDH